MAKCSPYIMLTDALGNYSMCLSPGRPPLPVPNQWAVCGPQVAGTLTPPAGTNVSELNPCPLNACCDSTGQCGITAASCTISKGATGSPGTAAPGEKGCISNCGSHVVNNDTRPSTQLSVGYFQPSAANRQCLRMDITQIDTTKYTHIHYAFATITSDLKISVNDFPDQFAKFTKLKGVKRIVSFGASQSANELLRQAVASSNRTKFVNSLTSFVNGAQIDGVELDWEYPATASEGADYAELLRMVKLALPNRLLSVAVPPSFFNLKAYPMDRIGKIVDYVVFMTYDMHGQWDYGSQWAATGCPEGSCVRSHVNSTETMDALSMITKAGVPAAKVVIGVTSYGRSFQLAVPGCSSANCQFTGPNSGAQPGRCTQYPGILAIGEIEEIIQQNKGSVKSWFDSASGSNILVYNATQWVAYMDSTVKATRTAMYKNLGFGGTVDWTLDYQGKLTASG
jgi:chitinase